VLNSGFVKQLTTHRIIIQQTIEPLFLIHILTLHRVGLFFGLSLEKNLMNIVELLGLSAGTCTTIAFLPQVIKTWKSRSAKDLSLGMFSFFCFGVLLWLVYGIFQHDVPVIAANLITLMLASTLLFFKLRFKN
jgi:MtN3 and saliva related transmembrane protein